MKKSGFTIICIVLTIICTLFFLAITKPESSLVLNNNNNSLSNEATNIDLSFTSNASTIKNGKAIYDILIDEKIPGNKISEAIESIKKLKQKIIIKPNLRYELFKDDEDDPIVILIELDQESYLSIDFSADKVNSYIKKIPLDVEYAVFSAKIYNSLFETLASHGFNDSIAYELNSIFMWDIDFNTDIRNGDQFTIIFEKYQDKWGKISSKKILGARLLVENKKYEAIGFYNEKGYFEYYDSNGRHLKKQFLNSPIKFARISSRFSYRRFHPVLKIFRPHLGIDYAAQRGTPVVATSSGKVIYKGWDKGGGGNALKIKHPNGFVTVYMHLQRFTKNIYNNKDIRQGDTIGFVGSTGLATGPHLDYRIQHNKKYINPLRFNNPGSGELNSSLLRYFKQYRDRLVEELNNAPNKNHLSEIKN